MIQFQQGRSNILFILQAWPWQVTSSHLHPSARWTFSVHNKINRRSCMYTKSQCMLWNLPLSVHLFLKHRTWSMWLCGTYRSSRTPLTQSWVLLVITLLHHHEALATFQIFVNNRTQQWYFQGNLCSLYTLWSLNLTYITYVIDLIIWSE